MMSSLKVYRCKYCKKLFLTAVDLRNHKTVDHAVEIRELLQDSQQDPSLPASTSHVRERLTANLNGKYTVVDPQPGNDSSDSDDGCQVVNVQLNIQKQKDVIADVCEEVSDDDSVSTEPIFSDGHPSPRKAADSPLRTIQKESVIGNKESSRQEEVVTQEIDKEAPVEVITLDDSDSDDGITFEKHSTVEFEKAASPLPVKPDFVPEQITTTTAASSFSGNTDVVTVDLDAESLITAENEAGNVTTSGIDENQNSKKVAPEGAKEASPRKKGRFSDTGRDSEPGGSSSSSEDDTRTKSPIRKPTRSPRTPEGLINTGGRLNCRFCGMPFRPIDYRRHADICSRNTKKIKTNMDRFLRLL